MRVGVIGCGYWGANHVRVLTELPEVTKVVAIDSRVDILRAIGDKHPDVIGRFDLTGAIDEIDAVIIATPPESHVDLGLEAIAAGKHLLIEKPMATNTIDARRLVAEADRAGVVLAAGHTFAHNDAVWKLASLVTSGELGRIHYLDSARLSLGLYRHDVNVLWDLAAHDISIANLVLGAQPDTVSAWGDAHTAGFGVDVATMRMTYERQGVTATIRSSWLDPEKVRRTTVVGSEKMALYDDGDPDAKVKVFDRGRRLKVRFGSNQPTTVRYRDGDIEVPYIGCREPLKVQARDFLRCCGSGERPVADGRSGLAVVAALEAADVSLRNGGAPVPVDAPMNAPHRPLAA